MGGSGCGQQRKRINPSTWRCSPTKSSRSTVRDWPPRRQVQATKELTASRVSAEARRVRARLHLRPPVLAVDTNVAKVTNALGWVTTKDEKQIHNELNGKGDVAGLIPRSIEGYGNLRRTLHSLLNLEATRARREASTSRARRSTRSRLSRTPSGLCASGSARMPTA